MLTLDSDPIGARDTERGAQELLNEFYKAFFNGEEHISQISPSPVTFPICDLFFNQTQLPSPAGKPQIHTVLTDVRRVAGLLRRGEEQWWDRTHKLVTMECDLSIFVRTANQGAQDNSADFLCRKTADQVKEIFESQDRYALAQKGIRHPRILRGPLPVGTVGFQVRLLIMHCQLQYKIPRTGA
jgi:hypothetical protein